MSGSITRLNAALEGRYRIEREIGEGGMATVYLAEDLRHERKIALKVLKPELAAVVGADRFLAEIKTTANLQHPHILPLHDSGEADGFLYFVMPYVKGDTLRDKIDREKQLSVEEALEITKKVASALDYAHQQGVVHRDIKPGNILLSSTGEPTVADFGIALAVAQAGGGRVTETGLSVGTPHYMSPEQATGDRDVDPRTDVYALGSVLYEMLTGDPPYQGSTAQAVLAKILTDPAPTPNRVRVSIPSNVDAAIRKALEKLPADRFATAQDLTRALADSEFRHGGEAVAAARVGRGVQSWAVAATVLAVVSTAGFGWALSRPTPPAPANRFVIDVPTTSLLRPGTVVTLGITPDGRTVVFNLATRESSQLFARQLGSVERVAIRGTENAGSFFMSPDGAWVAFNDPSDATFKRASLLGGFPETIAPTGVPGGAGFQGASWGDAGVIVFSTSAFEGLMQVPDAGGIPEPLTSPDGEIHSDPHLLPGGEVALFVVRRPEEEPQIAALSMESGEYRILTTGRFPQFIDFGGGAVVFARGDALWAAAFDADELALGGEPVPVLEGMRDAGQPFALSPEGTLVYAPASQEAEIRGTLVLVGRDGQQRSLGIEPQRYSYPRFSPDGGRLAVVVNQTNSPTGAADLWVFDLDRGSRTRLTFEGNNRYFPTWVPGGGGLAFADGPVAPANAIQIVAADGSGEITPLLERDGLQFPTSWSPDGSALVYHETTTESGRDLWVLRIGGDPEPFLVTPFQEHAAKFSPDGRWIAYVSNESGQDEIYVRPYPGPGQRQYTVSTNGGREPVWSPDGAELFYRSEGQLMGVAVELGDTFRAETPRPLFPDEHLRDDAGGFATPNYDVRPNGQEFIMLDAELRSPDEPALILIQNFAEELREAVLD